MALRAELERHGRVYGDLRFAVAWTDGVHGNAAKVARYWQTRPDRLSGPEHGAGLFRRGLTRNPVVALRASNLIGIDIDGEGGRQLVRRLLPNGLPRTVTVISGRADGGAHLWYRPPSPDWSHKIEFSADGLELGRDGYLVIPPAIHGQTGKPYRFAAGRAPWEHEIATLPIEILTVFAAHARRRDTAERADDGSPVPAGKRHKHLRRLAGAMRRVGAGEPTIAAALLTENARRCSPPHTEREVRALARDIVDRYPPGLRA
jgi:hypothetical protein